MRSPFPGMDPYLESRWSDVHTRLVGLVSESLQTQLPSSLRARSEENILLEGDDDEASYRGDVAIISRSGLRGERRPIAPGGAAVLEPVQIEVLYQPRTERWVQIIDRTNRNRIVTVIEILSPHNKVSTKGSAAYRKKVNDFLRGGASFVEIDLTRSPRRLLEFSRENFPEYTGELYFYAVRYAWQPGAWNVHLLELRSPIPALPVPLREGEAEVMLELQPLIEHAYRAGGHDDIDYREPLDPPIHKGDAAWVDALLTTSRKG